MSIKFALLLYGLPCSGKSMVSRALPGHAVLAVDEIITSVVPDPSLQDFHRLGGQIVEEMMKALQGMEAAQVVIEMGCLMSRDAVEQLEQFMTGAGIRFASVMLTASDDELIRRIKQRNADIDAGNSDSIKVDGPDYLTRFKAVFENNYPNNFITLDTTAMSTDQVAEFINSELPPSATSAAATPQETP